MQNKKTAIKHQFSKPIRPKTFDEPIYVTRPVLPPLERIEKKLREVWESKWLANGGLQHERLEQRLKQVLDVSQLSLFVNGTIALIVALQALRITGEVITTPFTFPATVHALSWNGIRPIFCDITEDTMVIDPGKIESLITPSTTAILGVHVYGYPCDIQAISSISKRYGLRLVFDAAHAFGMRLDGTGIGNFGDISMFSFHATKLFHTGEGGALTYGDPNLKTRIELLKNFGIKNETEVIMPGINGKMNELQAVLGQEVLDLFDGELHKRRILKNIYINRLSQIKGIKMPPTIDTPFTSEQYFCIRITPEYKLTRDQLYENLKEFNIWSRRYFYPLCSDYACYRQLPSAHISNLPVANRVSQEVLCLPFYGDLTEIEVNYVCDCLEYLSQE